MIRSNRPPHRAAVLALVGLAATLPACVDHPTAPEVVAGEPTDAVQTEATDPSLDPFVGLLIGSLEDRETARSARGWVDAVIVHHRRGAPLAVPLQALSAWRPEPTTPNDLVTLDALRLLMGEVPGTSDVPTEEENER